MSIGLVILRALICSVTRSIFFQISLFEIEAGYYTVHTQSIGT